MCLTVAAIAFAALIAPAGAEECAELFKLSGLLTRAGFVCDKAWLQRPAIVKTSRMIGQNPACSRLTEKQARANIAVGMANFDAGQKKDGALKACAAFDKFMKALDGD